MVRIIMLTNAASPEGTWAVGSIRTVPESVANELIAGNYAQVATPEAIKAFQIRNRETETGEWTVE